MKKLIVLAVVAFGLYSCQESAKIAFVDNSELVNEYQEKKDLEAKIKGKIENFQKYNDSIGRAFQLEVQTAQMKAAKMSKAKQDELMGQLQQKQGMLQQQYQISEKAISEESQALNDSLLNKVKDFVAEYGKTNGYDYILGKNEYVGTVYYGKEESDITKILLDKLNEKYAAEKK
ncbi:OmpH family outer membrane protein [Kordia sp.]|uniref:OmpH family outer membrane protein n=1 Tax=Kordia sp. TaxID=1965332 RepID=UPI003D2ABA60